MTDKALSYDTALATLPQDQTKMLLAAVKQALQFAFRQSVPKQNILLSTTDESIPIPPEDYRALAEYRAERGLTNKGERGKAKNIRKDLDYWEIVARLRGVDLEQVLPDSLKTLSPEEIEKRRREREEQEKDARDRCQAAEKALEAASSIDEALDAVVRFGFSPTNADAYVIEEAIAGIIREDRGNRFSRSDKLETAIESAIEDVRNELASGDLSTYRYEPDFRDDFSYYHHRYTCIPIESSRDLENMVHGEMFEDELVDKMVVTFNFDIEPYEPAVVVSDFFYDAFFAPDSEVGVLVALLEALGGNWDYLRDDLDCELADWEEDCRYSISSQFPTSVAISLIRSNPHYAALFEAEEKMEAEMLTRMPENPVELYPKARSLNRRFVLHIGPTNSGKTHDAMSVMASAPSGIYLGPLRLLAYEQYERLNSAGCPCTLITGEELREEAGASHTASTIEMLNPSLEYDVAVIDECQMMADPDRGNRWVEAILGVAAHEVHLCMAPEAEELAVRLVSLCADTFEIIRHERFTPLESWYASRYMDEEVQKGDALIVFSRRAVHALAADLKQRGFKCSIIYGALPYNVKHAQASDFASGKTDVVVATDAIGMGMNLPIHRVVFMEQAKFDGHQKRFLNASEVKQIAGRAGRYGIHEEGRYSSDYELKKIRKLYNQKVPSLKVAPLGFSAALLGVEGKVSSLMEKWAAMEVAKPFAKLSYEREISLARHLEELVDDAGDSRVKKLVYRFATLPFKDNLLPLKHIWETMFLSELAGHPYAVHVPEKSLSGSLDVLENEYAQMDLLFQYCRMFGYSEYYDAIQNRRDAISNKMIKLLGRQNAFEARKCRECGKPMPWNWPYPMCDPCHSELFPPRYDNDYYW